MALGDIGACFLDTLTLATGCVTFQGSIAHVRGFCTTCPCCTCIQIRTDIFVSAHHAAGLAQAFMQTFTVDCCGCFSLILDVQTITCCGSGVSPDVHVEKISNGIFALSYNDRTTCPVSIRVETWPVNACAIIGCLIDCLVITTCAAATSHGFSPLQHINCCGVTVFGAVFVEPTRDAQLVTFTIDLCGNIGCCVLSKVEFHCNVTQGRFQAVAWTGVGDFYAVTYSETSTNDGFVETWCINPCGLITGGCPCLPNVPIDNLEFDPGCGRSIFIDTDDAGTLVVAFNSGASGEFQIINVDACGQMTCGDTCTTAFGGGCKFILRICDGSVCCGCKNWWMVVSQDEITTMTINCCGCVVRHDCQNFGVSLRGSGSVVYKPNSDNIIVGAAYRGPPCCSWNVFTFNTCVNIADVPCPALPVPVIVKLGVCNYKPLGCPCAAGINICFDLPITEWREKIETGGVVIGVGLYNNIAFPLNYVRMNITVRGIISDVGHEPHPLVTGVTHHPDIIDLEEAAILFNKIGIADQKAKLVLPLPAGNRTYEGVIESIAIISPPGTTKNEYILKFQAAWNPSIPGLRAWNDE